MLPVYIGNTKNYFLNPLINFFTKLLKGEKL